MIYLRTPFLKRGINKRGTIYYEIDGGRGLGVLKCLGIISVGKWFIRGILMVVTAISMCSGSLHMWLQCRTSKI